ncbi:MAG: NAD(P)-binding domain-containing protein, partial [Oscillospiraceae bacterium]|nr:NAD(P)-binding domain-containing protein [Oscillospiraceae bacterium]
MIYGFIGLGNMAGAIIRGMYKSGAFENDTILGFNRSEKKTLKLKEETGLVPCQSESETAEKADVVILAVKPQMLPAVLPKI